MMVSLKMKKEENNRLRIEEMNQNIISVFKRRSRKCFPVTVLLLMVLMVSCDDMNSIHQKYFDWGEDIYTGVVDSLKVYPGYEKLQFEWEVNADPRITKTVIYWNQREDSVVVDVNRTQSGRLQMSYLLEDISEGDYIFELITRDNHGHFSLPREVVVTIYGDSYLQALRNRTVSSITHRLDGTMLIEWEPISSLAMQYTIIKYEVDGVEQVTQVENEDSETELFGLETGEIIQVSTIYLPENALDELMAPYSEYSMPKFEREINKANFSVLVLAGDNTSVNGVRDLSKIWDGATANPGILHTVENAPGFNFPHHFTFDMGVLADVSRFRIWPRTESGAFTGHSPRFFEIWGSDELKKDPDDEYWNSEAWKDDWKLMGDHEILRGGAAEWQAGWEYNVNEEIGQVRYIRLIIKNQNWQGSNCINIGEITIWGDDL